MNFQDVIRNVFNPNTNTLQVDGSGATIYAVVNTGAVGVQNSLTSIINTPTVYVGTPTLFAVVNTAQAGIGNSIVTINPRIDYIGLMSVSGNVNVGTPTVFVGTPTLNAVVNIPSSVGITGNVTLSDSKGFIGLTSIQGNVNLNAGINGIGFATVAVSTPTLFAVVNTGAAGVQNSMVTINPRTDYFGLVSISGNVVNLTGTSNIGSVSVLGGAIKIGGTNKTLVNLPIALSVGSIATIAVPTNANTVYVTNFLLNSDATVRVNILSGVTYLNGNASIGVTLNPSGGLVETGSPDSPTYIGCPSGALVVQKLDLTGTSSKLSGKVIYFEE